MIEKSPYRRAKDIIKSGELPNIPLSIKLKTGQEISNITPYAIVEGFMGKPGQGERTLRLFYLDKNKKAGKVDVNNVQGLNVVKGSGDFEGRLMIELNYFKGTDKADFREDSPRIVYATDIYFGIHPFHQGIGETKADSYVVADDSQYPDNRERQFPLWRVEGVYGNASKQVDKFKK